ncbi:hypothetical protein E2562_023890 [Oryza meyeriana var. granulata]|uniref:Subtilisin-like protease fibronectin type-III domain-containing protein n=1 Tax=Oryza meyeriana var. granulata TaxID=110450 RepID=A0A6G1D933_9ORYZ|nr:hypothetical protein E2562_023890 [Oryza meyeriana var. granulata]
MTSKPVTAAACPAGRGGVSGVNYPSIVVPVINYGVGFAVDVSRTVTNVGPADSVQLQGHLGVKPDCRTHWRSAR